MLTGPPPKFHGTWDILHRPPTPTRNPARLEMEGIIIHLAAPASACALPNGSSWSFDATTS